MNLQQVFDKVSNHLLTQNRKSMEDGDCSYHSSDGTKCAIGCLIPENMYTEEMEGNSVSSSLVNGALHPISVKGDMHDMLCDLQSVHDNLWPTEWTKALLRLAITYKLFFTPLPEGT